jgi:hypothetical protein
MTTLTDAKRALRMWKSPYVSRDIQRRNALKWLAATRALGSRWVLAATRGATQ